MSRQCAFHTKSGEPCRAAPVHDSQFCIMHSPEHAQEIQEARRLGGLRRRREVTVSGAYEFDGLETVAAIRRLLEIAILDTLGMENSIARNRTLGFLAQVALHALEVGELEQRVEILERAVHPDNIPQAPPVFDSEARLLEAPENKEEQS